MIYVASPYSHPDPRCQNERFWQVCRYTAQLIKAGNLAFSPIAHSHPVAFIGEMEGNFETWQRWCLRMLDACDVLYVLTLPGWQNSHGVMAEINHANRLGLSVLFVDPITEETFVNPEDINATC